MDSGLTLKVNTWNAYGCLEMMIEEIKNIASDDETSYNDKVRLKMIFDNCMEILKLIEYMRTHQSSIAKLLLEDEMRKKVTKEGMECSIL